jgi:hypothetical protein
LHTRSAYWPPAPSLEVRVIVGVQWRCATIPRTGGTASTAIQSSRHVSAVLFFPLSLLPDCKFAEISFLSWLVEVCACGGSIDDLIWLVRSDHKIRRATIRRSS